MSYRRVFLAALAAILSSAGLAGQPHQTESGEFALSLMPLLGQVIRTVEAWNKSLSLLSLTIFFLVLSHLPEDLASEYLSLYSSVEDKVGLEAIKALHQQLDDDNDGTIEPSETGDFIKADLQVK